MGVQASIDMPVESSGSRDVSGWGPPQRVTSGGVGCVIAAIVGVVLAAFLLVGAVVVATGVVTLGARNGGGVHEISIPDTAAGRPRDPSGESNAMLQTWIAKHKQVIRQASDNKITDIRYGLYGRGHDRYLFVGGTGKADPGNLPPEFSRAVNQILPSTKLVKNLVTIPSAAPDGNAVCVRIRYGDPKLARLAPGATSICAWATTTSFGVVQPAGHPDFTAMLWQPTSIDHTTVVAVMRDIRADVED